MLRLREGAGKEDRSRFPAGAAVVIRRARATRASSTTPSRARLIWGCAGSAPHLFASE